MVEKMARQYPSIVEKVAISREANAFRITKGPSRGLITNAIKEMGVKIRHSKCACNDIMLEHPLLKNDIGHIVLRNEDQFRCLFSEGETHVIGGNARNTLWHTRASFILAFERMIGDLLSLYIPIPNAESDKQYDL